MMNEHFYAVIMAGGGGTRLWPISRRSKPKQLLRLFKNQSLFQISVNRLKDLFPPENIFVVTVEEQAQALMEQCPEIPATNFLLEPMPRGTASVVGLAAVAIAEIDPDAVMAVLTADHFIRDEVKFREMLVSAYSVASQGYLVTLGIQPTYPATGYGYIQRGQLLGNFRGYESYEALQFKEKPDLEEAVRLYESGEYVWNSGMFFWRVERILQEFAEQMTDFYSRLVEIRKHWNTEDRAGTIRALWPDIRPQTIDYGVMEAAPKVAVIPAVDLGWSDVGSWDSLFELLDGDDAGNIVLGAQHLGISTVETMVYSEHPERLIVTLGVNRLVIVDTGDVLLVCDLEHAQEIRQVVDQLKSGKSEYL